MLIILLLPPGFRRFLFVLGGLALILLLTGIFSSSGLIKSLMGASGPVVVIDPGHGGVDGGTSGQDGTLEKEINLAIALRIRDHLRTGGANVVMTRTADTDLSPFVPGKTGRHRRDLTARIEKARKAGAVCLISIHCDWSKDKKRRGAVVFYNPRNNTSKELACLIQEELNKVQPAPQKAAPGNFFILNQSGLTAVLVEAGFLSHPEEAQLLRTPDYQSRQARAIANGIRRYYRW
ncbi:MAG: N-acetylmuramoyl-L-alanine amidase [Firmicutes bacterium]|nr:N-acetylmuramoyl-L-alanine amidase [Bacillota bacterium]